jgi:hypothetical protein
MRRQRYFGLGGGKYLISLKSAAGSLISKDRSVEEHLTVLRLLLLGCVSKKLTFYILWYANGNTQLFKGS